MRTPVDKDAAPFAAVAFAGAAIAGARHHRITAGVLAGAGAGVVAFFRDPTRSLDTAASMAHLVVSPADGRVMHAGSAEREVAPPGEWNQVTIFLSLANVHINRAPFSGVVVDSTYRPGRFHTAFTGSAGVENERREITVATQVDDRAEIYVFRQVVGILARRIVTRVEVGDEITTGQRIGLMRFGSRMDVFLPLSTRLLVQVGDTVRAGHSAIACWQAETERDLNDY